ncbi:hypothetical protein [Raineyella antarctica]|uniref:hypothetical protein n=1 Tax=Raineyella antarctica TaxID=1577474 RepID=UPI001587FE94|nr:hypothetical protein [Raineyella antarctica]
MDELDLVERVTSWGVGMGRRSTIERARFLDPVVNGILLRDHLQIDDMDAGCERVRHRSAAGSRLARVERRRRAGRGLARFARRRVMEAGDGRS